MMKSKNICRIVIYLLSALLKGPELHDCRNFHYWRHSRHLHRHRRLCMDDFENEKSRIIAGKFIFIYPVQCKEEIEEKDKILSSC
ncbi:unnamed protein product [Lactuca virosa]|uniref:Secreted protein n=1 Tax=Lactuca virosa TaxID=75947 RepID=A0AAU9LXB3_9ASTR|nr:unnamed protein product [Lactuca virosa]